MKIANPVIPSPASRLCQHRHGVLGEILADLVPELFADEARMAELIAAAAKIPAPDTSANAGAAVLAALDSGTLNRVDLSKVAGADADALARWERTRTTLTGVLGTLRERQDAALRRATPAILARLDAAHKAAVAALRTHPVTVRRVRSAEAAITSGLAEEWASYAQVRARCRESRDALVALTGLVDDVVLRSTAGKDAILPHVEHPERVWPDYLAWRTFGTGHRYAETGTTIGRPPWPHPDREREEFLDWLLTTDLVPWIPTPDQLAARVHELNTQARALNPRRPTAA
jgi:hypothetical protein